MRSFIALLLISVSVVLGQIEYQPIAGELLEHWNTTSPSHFPKVYYYDSDNLPDGIYQEMMIDRELTHPIPVRVYERISPEPAHLITNNYLFSNTSNYVINDGIFFASILGDVSDPDYGSGILALDIETGIQLWFYRTSDTHSGAWNLQVKDGRLYALANPKTFICLDSGTGQLIHLIEFSENVIAPYILTEDVLYMASMTEVIAFDLLTGETLWSFLDQAAPIGMYPSITNISIYGGMLYIGSISPNVRCLDAGKGELVWVSNDIMDSGGAGYANVAHISSNLIFVSTPSGELSLLDRSNGQAITHIENCKVMNTSEEFIYIYDFNSRRLSALDPESGAVTRVSEPMEGISLYDSHVIRCEMAIAFGCRNGTLLLVPIGDIRNDSREPLIINLSDSPLKISCHEGTIIAASETGDIVLINADTFEIVREIRTSIEITQPIQLYDGSLYFTSDSSLYSLALTSSGNNDVLECPLTGMEFVSIPSGSFQMGSPSSESGRDSDEDRHSVYVSSFELMTTEVTQGMWEEVMGNNPASGRGVGSNYPVYNVSWNDCQEFIDELNDMDPNHTYRLPSEAEWEYACRGGTTTSFYWGNSDSESTMGRYCWYTENSNSSTHPVGTKQPNACGLYDMSGNVWEWCEDVYTRDYDDCPTDGSAHWESGSHRVARGGSWYSSARYCRSAFRSNVGPGVRNLGLGLRLARS